MLIVACTMFDMKKIWYQVVVFGLAILATACGSSGGQTLEDFRSQFVAAGGICSATVPETTTTTEPESERDSLGNFASLEYLSCGDGEAGISRYESAQVARFSWWQLNAFLDGFMLSLGGDVLENISIVKDNFRISLVGEYSLSRAEDIAREIGGSVLSSGDSVLRKEILSEVRLGSETGGLDVIASACLLTTNLSSDKRSIKVDTKGEEDSDGDTVSSAFCLLRAAVMPDYVFDSIRETRALDGRVEETFDDYRVSWNYHPDSGLNLSLIFVG